MTRRRLVAICLAAASAFVASSCRRVLVPPSDVSVRFFDVGQGVCALLQTPEGKSVLFDAGEGARCAELIRRTGTRALDLVILSHPHEDHVGGLQAVSNAVRIGNVWYSGLNQAAWIRRGIDTSSFERVHAGMTRRLGSLELAVLHPSASAGMGGNDDAAINDNSLVVRAKYENTSYLFPGDCELPCWEAIFRRSRAELRSDVLLAAHHGAANGSNSGVFVNVRPSAFVISSGRENAYGHPDPLVLTLADKLGATIFRTDRMSGILCRAARCSAMP